LKKEPLTENIKPFLPQYMWIGHPTGEAIGAVMSEREASGASGDVKSRFIKVTGA
jgi:hypothetical protein